VQQINFIYDETRQYYSATDVVPACSRFKSAFRPMFGVPPVRHSGRLLPVGSSSLTGRSAWYVSVWTNGQL